MLHSVFVILGAVLVLHFEIVGDTSCVCLEGCFYATPYIGDADRLIFLLHLVFMYYCCIL